MLARYEDASVRQRIKAAALSWLGTPFHDNQRVKGAGVDCANYLIGVFSEATLIEAFEPEHYSPQWFLHRDEPRFLRTLERYARQITKQAATTGDVIMYNFGRHAAHGAIILDAHAIVHAYKYAHCVTRSDRRQFEPREHSFWSVL